MIKVQRRRDWHPIFGQQNDLSCETPNCPRNWDDDRLVDVVDDLVARQEQYGRRLSGSLNVYQRISPRFTSGSPTHQHPTPACPHR